MSPTFKENLWKAVGLDRGKKPKSKKEKRKTLKESHQENYRVILQVLKDAKFDKDGQPDHQTKMLALVHSRSAILTAIQTLEPGKPFYNFTVDELLARLDKILPVVKTEKDKNSPST